MSKAKAFFIKIWEFLKKFHWYGWVSALVVTGFQTLCYYLPRVILSATGSARAFIPKVAAIDNFFPLVPFFVVFYCLTFVYWGVAILATALTHKENLINMIIASMIASLIGFIVLTSWPTYIDRTKEGVEAVYNQPGFFNWLLSLIYDADGGYKYSNNLLPSFHCMTSCSVMFGTFRRKDSPLWWRITSITMLILICLSTLFTKQHYFFDVVSAIGIAAIAYIAMHFVNPGKRILIKLEEKKKA